MWIEINALEQQPASRINNVIQCKLPYAMPDLYEFIFEDKTQGGFGGIIESDSATGPYHS